MSSNAAGAQPPTYRKPTEEARHAILTGLKILAEEFEKEISPERAELWIETLGSYPAERIKAAFARALRTSTFWQHPADVLKLIEGGESARLASKAEEAWNLAMDYCRTWEWGDGPGGVMPGAPELPGEIEHAIRST